MTVNSIDAMVIVPSGAGEALTLKHEMKASPVAGSPSAAGSLSTRSPLAGASEHRDGPRVHADEACQPPSQIVATNLERQRTAVVCSAQRPSAAGGKIEALHTQVERREQRYVPATMIGVLHGALGGGGTVSLMTDAQGKVYSTALLRAELEVPDDVLASLAAGRGER